MKTHRDCLDPFHVGISGWRYAGWRKNFYPKKLPQRKELEFASSKLKTIEINGTFYSLQRSNSFEKWYESTPDHFIFSVKGPRFITHVKRLKNVEGALSNFFASGVLALKEKLGPILWQLPPNFRYDPAVLEAFFKMLPFTTTSAARRARQADDHFRRKPYLKSGPRRALQYCLEVRHPSFDENKNEFLKLLKKYKIALVCADAAAEWPHFEDLTSNFAYVRLHGGSILYTSQYTPQQLKIWAKKFKKWRRKGACDVFVYFDNDAKVHAPADAQTLEKILKTRS
jgi:uncharacterized protein YecE (DUF72 family)